MTRLILTTIVGFLSINAAAAGNAPLLQIRTWNDLRCDGGKTPTIRLIASTRRVIVTCE